MRWKGVIVGLAAVMLFAVGLATGHLIWSAGTRESPLSSSPNSSPQVSSVSIPDVTGLGLGAAADVLASLGLRVDSQTLRARPGPDQDGTVVSQEAPAGSLLDVGTSVTLVVSAGPHPQQMGGRVFVGGTCDLVEPRPSPCIGGPLLVRLQTA